MRKFRYLGLKKKTRSRTEFSTAICNVQKYSAKIEKDRQLLSKCPLCCDYIESKAFRRRHNRKAKVVSSIWHWLGLSLENRALAPGAMASVTRSLKAEISVNGLTLPSEFPLTENEARFFAITDRRIIHHRDISLCCCATRNETRRLWHCCSVSCFVWKPPSRSISKGVSGVGCLWIIQKEKTSHLVDECKRSGGNLMVEPPRPGKKRGLYFWGRLLNLPC